MRTIEDAFRCMMRGKYLDAESVYQDIVGACSDNVVAFLELSWVYLLQHKYAEAEIALRQVVRLAPENIIGHSDLARVCLLQRKYEEAENSLEQCVKLAPGDISMHYQLGRIYRLQGKHGQAEAIFEQLQQVAPYISVEKEDRFFDSLIQLEPVNVDSSSAEEMTMEDPRISSQDVDMTLMDPACDPSVSSSPLGTISTHPAQKSPTSAHVEYRKAGKDSPKNLAGMVFDDFLAKERLLGQGGMGEVYLVKHLEWDQKLAVKRCLQTDNEALLERFRQECLTWLSLEKHPNVVSAVHFTSWEGKPSLLIEYIEGKTLKEFLHDLRISAMIERILNKLGNRPPLSNTMSLLTYLGIAEERKEIAQAWMGIIKEYSSLSIEEVKNILREAKAFPEHEIEFLQNSWFQLKSPQNIEHFSLARLVDYSLQICRGMGHAHRHGMLHRDLKPANILIEKEVDGVGQLKVTDFGLAKMKGTQDPEAPARKSDDGNSGIAGTPRYMAPEQWDNESSEKSDIYSLGIIMYELFSRGGTPFSSHIDEQSKTPYWWAHIPQQNEFYYWSVRHCSEQPTPLVTYVNDVPKNMERLIFKCLEKDPKKRPASFDEIADNLLEIYAQVSGKPYPREQNISPELMAMELNNRAVSMLEMGFSDKGSALLSKALQISPNLIEAQLNQALFELLNDRLSTQEFANKALNCFQSSEKDIMVLGMLAGVYFKHGSQSRIVRECLEKLESKFAKELKFKRLKGKLHYLLGDFSRSAEIYSELSSLENARIEDWYHFIGSLYHQHKFDLIEQMIAQVPGHFRFHPCFREMKRILQNPQESLQPGLSDWYEIETLESDYGTDLPISFVKNDPRQDYFLVYHSKAGRNICECFHIPTWELKSWVVSVPNAVKEEQVVILPNNRMAVFSIQGEIYLFDLATSESKTLPCQVPAHPGYRCLDGFLWAGGGCLLAVCHLQNEDHLTISYAAVWHQKDWKLAAHWQVGKAIRHAAIYDASLCWLADEHSLYTWNMPKQAPAGQVYGYSRQTENGHESANILRISSLPKKKLLVVLQQEKMDANQITVNGSLMLFLWDLLSQNHKKATIENFVVSESRVSYDKKKLFLLSVATGDQKLICWDIENWKLEKEQPLGEKYHGMSITPDSRFMLLHKELGSFLDLTFDQLESCNQQFVIYGLKPFKETKRLISDSEVIDFTGTISTKYMFMACQDQKIRVWKNIDQSPFPLLHKLTHLYLKPRSTIQEIGLQKRIQKLLQESDKAMAENNPQKALDYMRGIQNFKGYDWKLILYRIYSMAQNYQWEKIGLRESLKTNKFLWNERDFIISPAGEYLIPGEFSDDCVLSLWDVATLKKVSMEQIIENIPHYRGRWFSTREGRFILQQDKTQLIIHDLQQRLSLSPFEVERQFQEAIANEAGDLLLLKQEGFNQLSLLDLSSSTLVYDISQAKYHSILDCCIMVAGARKIMLATEVEGGFRWEMIAMDGEKWQSKSFELPFTEELIEQGKTDQGETQQNMIANRSYIVFRGTNFDLMHDLHFRHIEVFELKHGIYFSLKGQKFSKDWVNSQDITTTPNGAYTFLSDSRGSISAWNTARHIKNWKQTVVLHEHEHPVTAMTVTFDSKFLISGDAAGYIKIIRIGSWEKNAEKPNDWEVLDNLKADGAILSLKVSPNDRYLFALGENAVHVWEFDWLWEVERYIE